MNKADSFLKRHAGINYKEFLGEYEKGDLMKKPSENKALFYLSALEDIENGGFNLEGFLDELKKNTLSLQMFLENYVVNSRIKNTLSKSHMDKKKSLNLTTLVSRDLFNKMFQGEIERKILVGKRYHDLKSNIDFDILLNAEDFDNLSSINNKETPIVPYFSYGSLKNPQRYFLSLNKQFPEINKVFGGSKGNNPRLFRLIETNFKRKMFTIGSYLTLNENN